MREKYWMSCQSTTRLAYIHAPHDRARTGSAPRPSHHQRGLDWRPDAYTRHSTGTVHGPWTIPARPNFFLLRFLVSHIPPGFPPTVFAADRFALMGPPPAGCLPARRAWARLPVPGGAVPPARPGDGPGPYMMPLDTYCIQYMAQVGF